MRGLFPVSGCVNCAGLGFRLGFGGIDFAGLAPLPTPGRFVYWHNDCFLGFLYANIPGSGRNLAGKMKKMQKKSKNYSKTFGF